MQTAVTREIFEDVCQAGLLGSSIPENFGVFFLKLFVHESLVVCYPKNQYRQDFFWDNDIKINQVTHQKKLPERCAEVQRSKSMNS